MHQLKSLFFKNIETVQNPFENNALGDSYFLWRTFGWPARNIHFTDDNGYLATFVNINPFLYQLWLTSIVTIHRFWLPGNTTADTSRAGVAYPSGAPELTLVFVGFVLLSFSFYSSFVCSMLYDCHSFHFVGHDLVCLPT